MLNDPGSIGSLSPSWGRTGKRICGRVGRDMAIWCCLLLFLLLLSQLGILVLGVLPGFSDCGEDRHCEDVYGPAEMRMIKGGYAACSSCERCCKLIQAGETGLSAELELAL